MDLLCMACSSRMILHMLLSKVSENGQLRFPNGDDSMSSLRGQGLGRLLGLDFLDVGQVCKVSNLAVEEGMR